MKLESTHELGFKFDEGYKFDDGLYYLLKSIEQKDGRYIYKFRTAGAP